MCDGGPGRRGAMIWWKIDINSLLHQGIIIVVKGYILINLKELIPVCVHYVLLQDDLLLLSSFPMSRHGTRSKAKIKL